MQRTLYYKELCPYCQKVLGVIHKLEMDDIDLVDITCDENAQKYLIDKGGKKQVPCLFIGDEPLYESQAIIDYLQNN